MKHRTFNVLEIIMDKAFPDSLFNKLEGCIVYRDNVCQEHLYDTEATILMAEQGCELTKQEQEIMTRVDNLIVGNNAAYFRIVI